MDSDQYGIYSLIVISVNIISLLYSGFISNSIMRLYDDYKISGKEKEFVSTSISFIVFLSPVLTFLILISNYEYKYFLILASLGFSINNVITAYYRVSENALKYNLFKISPVILQMLIILFFLLSDDINFAQATVAHYIPLLIFSLLGLLPLVIVNKMQIKKSIIKNSLYYSFPLVIVSLLNIFISSSDRFIIAYFSSNHYLGLYSFSYKMTELIMVTLVNFIMIALYPMLIKTYNKNGVFKASKLLSKYFYIQLFISIPILIVILLYSDYYLEMFFPQYVEAKDLFKVLSIGTLIFSLTYYFNKSFEVGKKAKIILLILIQTSILNIVLNILLIPFWGIKGAAYATIISYIYYLVICIIKSRDLVKVLLNKKVIVALFGVVGVSLLGLSPFYILINEKENASLIYTCLFFLMYSMIIFIFKERLKKMLD